MKEAAVPAHDTETSTSSWDGPAVVAAIPSTATEADLKSVFAWEDSEGEPDAKASYKFPHHNGVDGPANMTACSAGIAALNGGRGGADIPAEDRQGVWEHLAKHLEDGGAEEVPPLGGAEPASEADLGMSFDDRRSLIQAAVNDALGIADDAGWESRPYIRDIFDLTVVWQVGGKSFMADYTIEGDSVTLGSPTEVRVSYQPVGQKPAPDGPPAADEPPMEAFDPKNRKAMESLAAAMIADPKFAASVKKVAEDLTPKEVDGDFVALTERAVADDGTAMVRVIVPGWGSSGYYAPEVLERDGPKVFTKGTQMFWNHQTEREEDERPEGDLRDLAGELIEDAHWEAEGPEGPGLYAKTKVFAGFRDVVEELAPHIGVSIRAMGKASHGSVEGREGPVIDALTYGRSVDFVTAPGAGGKVLSLFEAAGRKGDEQMDQKELKEAQDAAKAAKEELAKRDATDIVREALSKSSLPEASKKRLGENLKPTLGDDGSLDADAWKTTVDEAVASEVAYLTEVTGAGSVRNLGGGADDDEGKIEEDLARSFQDMGLSEATAKVAANGRR
jgi:hypothetical protein